jgi:hypothetical protein
MKLRKIDTSKSGNEELYVTGTSLGIFGEDSGLRQLLFRMLTSKAFE